MFIEPYFNNNIFKTTKIKKSFFNSDKRNTSNNKNYLSLLRNIELLSTVIVLAVEIKHQINLENIN